MAERDIVERLEERLEQIGGCTDGNCMIRKPKGQHTNGGCRCARDPLRMQQVVYAQKQAITALRSRLEATEGVVGPFARLGAILNGREKDDAIFVGQVIRGATPAEDRHHPITFGDLRRAAALANPDQP